GKRLRELRGFHDYGVVHLVFGGEFRDIGRGAFVRRHADDLQLVLVALLQLDQIGNLFAARGAPGRPEIHQGDLALPVLAAERAPVEGLQRELRNRHRILHEPDRWRRARGGRGVKLLADLTGVSSSEKTAESEGREQNYAEKRFFHQ